MIELKDQMNNIIRLGKSPKRIISLVPSQTEFLYDLGLENEVVGITKFCIHPNEWFKSKQRIGGTKTVDFEKIKSLQPDLIIANKEENTKSEIEELQKLYTVYVSDIFTLEDSYRMMIDIGNLTDKKEESLGIIQSIKSNFEGLAKINKKVLYLIWRDPYMAAGKNTFINHVIEQCGLENALPSTESRYEELSASKISKLDLDYIFLSSEPYPFKEKHITELELVTNARVILVDGELFSWYGSRLLRFKNYFESFLCKL